MPPFLKAQGQILPAKFSSYQIDLTISLTTISPLRTQGRDDEAGAAAGASPGVELRDRLAIRQEERFTAGRDAKGCPKPHLAQCYLGKVGM